MALIKVPKVSRLQWENSCLNAQNLSRSSQSLGGPQSLLRRGTRSTLHTLSRHILLAPRNTPERGNLKALAKNHRASGLIHQNYSPRTFICCECLPEASSRDRLVKSLERVYEPPEDSQPRVSSRIRDSCRLSHRYKLDM